MKFRKQEIPKPWGRRSQTVKVLEPRAITAEWDRE